MPSFINTTNSPLSINVTRRASGNQWWNQSGPSYEAFTPSHVANYGIVSSGAFSGADVYDWIDPTPSVPGQWFAWPSQSGLLQLSDMQWPNVATWEDQVTAGIAVTLNSGALSGQPMYLSSGGLDAIMIESGMNMRQAQCVIAASCAGQLSGAGTSGVWIQGAYASGITRIQALVNNSGDRVQVSLILPP
jgi:hypothetical protein